MAFFNRKLMCLFAALFIFSGVGVSVACAEDVSAAVTAPAEVSSGDTFEVTVTFSSDENIGWFETNITYDSKLIEYTSGNAAGGEGNLHLRCFPDQSTNTLSETLKFKALKEGSVSISLLNCSVFTPDGVPFSSSQASAEVTVKGEETQSYEPDTESSQAQDSSSEQTDASRCVLKSLTFSKGELMPAFSPDIFDYTVKLPADVYKVEVNAERESADDFIWFECSSWLSKTEDPKQIIVNIYDGDVKLKITVKDKEEDPTVTNIYRVMFTAEASESSSSQEDQSETETESKAAAVTTLPADSSQIGTSASVGTTEPPASPSGVAELRDKLMPWLLVILLVLIIALILIVYWIRSRTDRKRRKIKSSGRK